MAVNRCAGAFYALQPVGIKYLHETHAEGLCITNHGATIWCLGFKTEDEGTKLWADAGAQTEILGAFILPSGKIPEDRPIFKNTDSRMAVVYGTTAGDADHRLQILDVQGEDAKRIGNEQLLRVGSRGRMDLFTSDATQKAGAN